MTELPKLPEPSRWVFMVNGTYNLVTFSKPPDDGYDKGSLEPCLTVAEAQAYGAECRRQALEEAAKVCDAEASIEGIAQRCAAAIRGMMK